jgi:hypothetical protein
MPRNRSLAEVNHKFLKNSSIIESLLDERLAGGGDRPLNVLEVGCGHGRVLTELAILYHGKPMRFHGVTLEQRPEFKPGRRGAAYAPQATQRLFLRREQTPL